MHRRLLRRGRHGITEKWDGMRQQRKTNPIKDKCQGKQKSQTKKGLTNRAIGAVLPGGDVVERRWEAGVQRTLVVVVVVILWSGAEILHRLVSVPARSVLLLLLLEIESVAPILVV